MSNIIISKLCPKCNTIVLLKNYRTTQRMCVACSKKYYQQYRKANKATINAKRKLYFAKKALKEGRVINHRNATRRVEKIEPYFVNKRRTLYMSAKRRNIFFNLSVAEVRDLIKNASTHCPYCQQPLVKNSIDRKDNEVGYTKENCIVVCMNCNILKSNTNKTQIKNIYLYLFGNIKPSEIEKTL